MMKTRTKTQNSNNENNEGALSVSNLNALVRDNLQGDPRLQNIWVEGEVFNYTLHSSGHMYFSLKDEGSLINCTFFRNANARFRNIKLQNGVKVMARGSISVYLPRGNYQLNITSVSIAGEGDLRLKIEETKRKLHQEGLFDPARKKPLPFMPMTLGVVTAPTGAAIQDIIRVARHRFPDVNILLAPCLVQGNGAEESIVAAIEALNDPELGVDVIIAGRGGGSFEDLLAFNMESVARAYAASNVPIISAVGHEIDNPMTDMAADAYAATPSAAVERAVPVIAQVHDRISEAKLRLEVALKNKHQREKEHLKLLLKASVYLNPRAMLEPAHQRLDLTFRELKQRLGDRIKLGAVQLQTFQTLPNLYEKLLIQQNKRYSLAAERLENFSPLGTLKRGYSVVRNRQKDVIRNTHEIKTGEQLEIILSKGKLEVTVDQIIKAE